MGLLTPLFLLGLAGIAIPILIHLTRRQRTNVVQFPSLMFLERIPFKSRRRQTIENWPLLLLRVLALTIIVAAFARPLFQGSALADGLSIGPEEVIVLVDRSYSMGYGDRWGRAKDEARSVIQGIGPEDLATLVFFGSSAQVTNRSTADVARLTNALDTVQVSSYTTRYGPPMKVAQTIVEESRLPNRRVVLISDFQKNGWLGDEGVSFPEGTVVESIPILDESVSNAAIGAPEFQRELFSNRERVVATARITHTGTEAAEDIRVTLEVDGRELQTRTVSLAADDATTVTFDPFTLTESNTRGRIHLSEDALPQDNEVNFALSPNQGVSILVLENPGAGDESLYLSQALRIGSDPAFRVEVKSTSRFQGAADLQGRSVVVLNNTRLPAGAGGADIERFVQEGGGLLVILGSRSAWSTDDPDLLPGIIEAAKDIEGARGGTFGYIDFNHPVFEIFRRERSGDLTSARVFRYRPLTVEGSEGVIARLDNGDVAIAERTVGEGRVLVSNLAVDNFWSDLVLQPIFLPVIHQVGLRLADFGESPEFSLAGQVLDLWGRQGPYGPTGPDEDSEELVALTPSGGSIPLPIEESARFLGLAEQGFYEIRRPGSSGGRPFIAAVNVDLVESDLTPADTEEMMAALSPTAGVAGDPAAGEQSVRNEDLERRQALWRYLLIGAFLLLAVETVLSNRMSRAAA